MQLSLKVDVYGSCGKPCPRNQSCFDKVYGQYKFYLALENSLCQDYVTEKLFLSLAAGAIPVVMGKNLPNFNGVITECQLLGKANYSALVPINSVINVADYSSAGELAVHLQRVATNQHLYSKYHAWRSENVKVITNEVQVTTIYLRKPYPTCSTGWLLQFVQFLAQGSAL